MARSSRLKVALTAVGVPILMVAAFGWVTYRRYEQAKMDAPLIKAIKARDSAEVRRLLDSGADPNARDRPYRPVSLLDMAKSLLRRTPEDRGENYNSALMVAAKAGGTAEIAKLLLDHGAQVNARGPGRTTALLEAAETDESVLKILLDRGADVTALNADRQDAVLRAIKVKKEACAALLLARGGQTKAREADGHTAMAWAVENHLPTLIGPLLKAGAGPNDADQYGKTPLGAAIAIGSPKIVKDLLDHRADPNLPSEKEPPLDRAYEQVDASSSRDYYEDEPNPAKPADRREVMRLLLAGKADPNTKDSQEVLILFRAMRDGETEIVQQLLKAGANANMKEKDQPALLEAVTLRDPKVVKMLLDKGADIKVKDPEGTTALMIAAFNGDEEIAKMLLKTGADPNAKDRLGATPLDYARESPKIAAMIRAASAGGPPAGTRR